MKRGEEKRMRRRRRRREEKNKKSRYEIVCMDFCMEKSNHKPFFFFYEVGSKRTLLGILVMFGSFRLDLKLFWFGFVVDLGLYGN